MRSITIHIDDEVDTESYDALVEFVADIALVFDDASVVTASRSNAAVPCTRKVGS